MGKVGWFLAALLAAMASCSDDDEVGPDPETGGSGGNPAVGGARSGAGGTAGNVRGGNAGLGGTGGRAGASSGGSAPTGGVGGEAGQSLCIDDYDLSTYTGSTSGLCPARDSAHWYCCNEDGFDQAGAGMIYCAADGSHCYFDPMFCTRVEFGEDDCGWIACGMPSDTGAGGEAGAPATGCPRSLRCDWDTLSCDGYEPTGIPCASDAHCAPDRVCNHRIDNRMFCGEPP